MAVIGTRNIDDLIKKERMQEAKLKEAYIVAEEANKAKTDFLNNMSHDIRTPMNVILGYNELMKQYLTDPILVDYQIRLSRVVSYYFQSLIMCWIWRVLRVVRWLSKKEPSKSGL